MATTTQSDKGLGLGLLFSLVAVGAAIGTAVLGFQYALAHGAGAEASAIQTNAAFAFGLSMLAAGLAVTAVHVYGN